MTGPGPNDIIPCPSRECSTWHVAHGRLHRCGVDRPAPGRLVRPKLREGQRYPLPLPDDTDTTTLRLGRGGSAGVA